jgi:hypothetical protein
MGADLGVRDADHRRPSVDNNWRYWLCYWLTFVVLVSLSLRFVVGSAAHSDSLDLSKIPTVGFIRDFVFLIAFGVVLVEAALARSHRYFMMWLVGFSAGGIAWSLLEWNSDWGHWWFCAHSSQFAVTSVCCWFAPKEPAEHGLDDCPYVLKLTVLLTALAAFYIAMFIADITHILAIPSSGSAPTLDVF